MLEDLLTAPWIRTDQEQKAVALAAATLVPEHFKEVADRRVEHVDKTLAAVHERLTKEIAFWTDREIKLKDDRAAGKDVRLNLDNVKKTLDDLQSRLEGRKKELQAMRQVQNGTPVILGGALVVPAGLLRKLRGEGPGSQCGRRRRPQENRDARHAGGHRRPRKPRGTASSMSRPKSAAGMCRATRRTGTDPKHIEVKGRVKGADTITVSRNEILYAFNQGEKFVLAIVFVNPDDSDRRAVTISPTRSSVNPTGERPA